LSFLLAVAKAFNVVLSASTDSQGNPYVVLSIV
jgi:hypothetical protein